MHSSENITVSSSVSRRTTSLREPFAADMCEWEKSWSHRTNSFPSRSQGDAIAIARRLRTEYAHLLYR